VLGLDGGPEIPRNVPWQPMLELELQLTDGFVSSIATMQLLMEGGFESSADGMQILPIPAPKGRCYGNHFLVFDGL